MGVLNEKRCKTKDYIFINPNILFFVKYLKPSMVIIVYITLHNSKIINPQIRR